MKKAAAFFIVPALFLIFSVTPVLGQERSNISVKRSNLNNGVMVVDIVRDGKSYRLICNDGMPGCSALKGGKYQIVELPKNFGMYECKDVEVYAESSDSQQRGPKLGEYCLEDAD
jgi:hypothetical protein